MGLKGNPLGSDILSLFSEEQNIVAFFIQIFLKINFFFFFKNLIIIIFLWTYKVQFHDF